MLDTKNSDVFKEFKSYNVPAGVHLFDVAVLSDFLVEDPVHGQVNENAVPATVNITVKRISKEAVLKSGSKVVAAWPP